MHPEISRSIAAQHMAELHRRAERERLVAQYRRAGGRRPAAAGPLARVRLAAAHLPLRRLPGVRAWVARPGRMPAAARHRPALPGVFAAGPEAFGLRTYLTAAEARQLADDWASLLSKFADRMEDPSRRPPGSVPFEVVVLGRQVPDLAHTARGLPGA